MGFAATATRKRHCTVSGCRGWSEHGRDRCRPHRDSWPGATRLPGASAPSPTEDPWAAPAAPSRSRPVGSWADYGDDTPLAEVEIAVIDVETSALQPTDGHVIQIAVTRVRGDGTVVGRWSSLVRPPDGEVGMTHLHGISKGDVRDARPFEEVLPEFIAAVDGASWGGHNIAFDRRWMHSEMKRVGYQPPEDLSEVCSYRLTYRTVDRAQNTYAKPDHETGVKGDRTLGKLTEHYGIEMERWHDAQSDTDAAAALLPHLLADCRTATTGELRERLDSVEGTVRWAPYDPATARTWRRRVARWHPWLARRLDRNPRLPRRDGKPSEARSSR